MRIWRGTRLVRSRYEPGGGGVRGADLRLGKWVLEMLWLMHLYIIYMGCAVDVGWVRFSLV